jgi:hypothetical protein
VRRPNAIFGNVEGKEIGISSVVWNTLEIAVIVDTLKAVGFGRLILSEILYRARALYVRKHP